MFALLFVIGARVYADNNEGAIAIYRESTGGDAMTTSIKGVTWDTTVREDSTYSLQADNESIRLLESGRYFVLYNMPVYFNGSNNNRQEIQTYVNIAGTSLGQYGHARGYVRSAGSHYNSWQAAGVVFDHTYDNGTATNNDLSISWVNTDRPERKGPGRSLTWQG